MNPRMLKIFDTYVRGSDGIFVGFDTADIIENTEIAAVDYYLERGSRYVSPIYERLYTICEEDIEATNSAVAEILLHKYTEKWLRIKQALIDTTYSPLTDYEHMDKKTRETTTKQSTSDTVTSEGSVASKETNTNTRTSEDSVYGFNSAVSVPSNGSNSSSESVTEGIASDNTTHGTTSTDGKSDATTNETETHTITGRNTSGADLVKKELDLRSKAIYLDIIFKDIDSMITLSVY